jgi:hypothetical protein
MVEHSPNIKRGICAIPLGTVPYLVRLPAFSAFLQASMEEAELFLSRLLEPVLSTSLPDSGPM